MSLIESICRELEAGRKLALVSVVEQNASSPRHAGASMVVAEEGLVDGTVGGGAMEGVAIEAGKKAIAEKHADFCSFDLTNEDAANSDMICGGSMRLFAQPLLPDVQTKTLFQRLRIAAATGDDMVCVTPVVAPGHRRLCRMSAKEWPLPVELRDKIKERAVDGVLEGPCVLETSDKLSFVVEPWTSPWRLVIAGGGHVSKATAKLAASVGFCVSVLDDREEFLGKERFPDAALTREVPEYKDCYAGFRVNAKTFLAIMTRGHLFDRIVLQQALETEAGYIGMIGSKRKTELLFAKLEEEGVSRERLAFVTTPIGLAIGAETPEEIAVSIVAQLVAVRARKSGSTRHLAKEFC